MSLIKVAKVIINNPSKAVDKCFDYLYDDACIGDHVIVPFGRGNTKTDGVIIGFDEVEYNDKLKSIESTQGNILSEKNIHILKWMRKKCVCTYFDCLKELLPPGAMSSKRKGYSGVGEKTIKFARVCVQEEYLDELIAELLNKAPAQARVLDILCQFEQLPVVDLGELAMTTRNTISSLQKKGFIEIYDKAVERNSFADETVIKSKPLVPNDEQKVAIDFINNQIDNSCFCGILLRGITGSGKTEVYLQAVSHAVENGKKAIILVPEISLTPQMSERFRSRLGDKVAIFHSGLSLGERFDCWNKIKSGEIDVVVGARSAIFTPIDNIGIIVVDEEHENSYKSDMSPKYDAREVAEELCKLHKATLVLASATPSMKSAYRAVKGELNLLQIKNRYNNVQLPDVDIIDLRYELSNGNKSFLSLKLQQEIRKNIDNGEQTILFLNRRGFSTFVSCRNCGYAAVCPECDIALTYHKYNNSLVCHYCGYTVNNYSVCPKCNSSAIRYFGIGTQKVEEELKNLFPDASVIRMDNDTTREKLSHHKILKKFSEEKIDILVGTQMITKGLDFPNVSLVGVLAADMMLYVDDYQAAERTFQLITQVCGRAGRGSTKGRALIQTYSPDHWVIDCASKQDFREFYKKEIFLRKNMSYPPFGDIINVVVSGENGNEVKNNICRIALDISHAFDDGGVEYTLLGPTPAPLSRINNKFRWRFIVKCKASDSVRDLLRENVSVSSKSDVTISLDINPNNMM